MKPSFPLQSTPNPHAPCYAPPALRPISAHTSAPIPLMCPVLSLMAPKSASSSRWSDTQKIDTSRHRRHKRSLSCSQKSIFSLSSLLLPLPYSKLFTYLRVSSSIYGLILHQAGGPSVTPAPTPHGPVRIRHLPVRSGWFIAAGSRVRSPA